MHLLKSNSVVELSFSFSFAIRFTFTNSSFLRVKNWLFFKIIVLSVCILMIPNRVPVIVIRKHGLNIKVVINSFSLWCLL